MKHVTLNDRYDLSQSRIFVNGAQAVVRLALMQHERDARAGLNTAGYITGYRGSPLGNLDQQVMLAERFLTEHSILFQPGLNEDLAATALWGAQMAELRGQGLYDGVFGIWYGKGPGVDRSGDVFRHANHAGTSKHGGVLALMGDDHTCESSTSAHQSEFKLIDAMMPVMNPAGLQEILDYGLYGWALSRFAGVWTGIKCVKDNIEQSASIDGSVDRVQIILPKDFDMPPGGLNIRRNDRVLDKERRLFDYKLPAIRAFTRANGLDRLILEGGGAPRIGIITSGKSYNDTVEALDLLGIAGARAASLGVRLYKLGVTWPLEPDGARQFALGLETVLVVEEKRALIETQLKDLLYREKFAPAIIGKRDEDGSPLLPSYAALDAVQIARVIGERLLAASYGDEELRARLEQLDRIRERTSSLPGLIERIPYFCAGCPHNSSTVVPEDAHAYAGIGCHYMVQWMDRSTEGFTHMGGEGANWIGEAPFSKEPHIFQNVGDGTYVHSGSLAIRAAVAAGTTMTFKVLFNDAVAMTGGQGLDGELTVPQLAQQIAAEGVARVVVVAEDPDKYPKDAHFPPYTPIYHRDELARVQRELQKVKGVSVLIYDQTCAAELRRRRRRGMAAEPDERVFINELVCEGCGDCGVQSNCVAIVPVETEFGRKRAIDQTACNKDFSCLKGFCPSFVTVRGGDVEDEAEDDAVSLPELPDMSTLPEPALPDLTRPYSMVVTGVGGTGVVTIGALIGMAAHIEEKGVGIIDMSGLAQKGGAVAVHLRIGKSPDTIKSIRASAAGADLVMGCDLVVAASDTVLSVVQRDVTRVIANDHESMTGDFTRSPDMEMPAQDMRDALTAAAGRDAIRFVDAHALSRALLGDTQSANVFLLGYVWQMGQLPLSLPALEQAIRLNGVAVDQNLAAFSWGRLAAEDEPALTKLLQTVTPLPAPSERVHSLDEVIERRADFLTQYQNAAYAATYRARVEDIRRLEQERVPSSTALVNAVANGLFKLMAYKDEYEVARLMTDNAFRERLEKRFGRNCEITLHLAPPLFSQLDPVSGRPQKRRYGRWMMHVMRLLGRARTIRGTLLDPFRYAADRKLERALLQDYEALLVVFSKRLDPNNHALAVELATLPESIRGYGPVKEAAAVEANARRADLLAAFDAPVDTRQRAA
ncbi:MAG: indolepyruvate ferredoxin oxidoreductase family protein [Pseudomonadota bacterium]